MHCHTALLFVLLSAASLSLCRGQQKSMVLIGGGLSDDNAAVWGRFIELSGGVGVARVGIVTAASDDPDGAALYYASMLEAYGAVETYFVPVHENNPGAAINPAVIEKVSNMTGFFFGGGDQARIVRALFLYDGSSRIETPVMAALRQRFDSGLACVGGTSAGAAAMTGAVMITAGVSYDALLYGAAADSPHPDDLTYDKDGGIGLLQNIVVDTHFSERGREGRLIRLLADTQDAGLIGTTLGVGLDEDTALVITADTNNENAVADIIGKAGVYFIDVYYANIDTSLGYWSIDTVYTHYLRDGDSISLSDWISIEYAAYKQDLAGQEQMDNAETSSDVFGGSIDDPPEIPRVTSSLINSRVETTWGDTAEDSPQFRLNFVKGSYTVGYGGLHPVTNKLDISYQDVIVDIRVKVVE